MSSTTITGQQIRDGSVQRTDIDTTTPGQAVITRLVNSSDIGFSTSTGADTGTGDVTLVLTTTGVTAGTIIKPIVDSKGRVTGSGGALLASDLPDSGVVAGTWQSVVVDAHGIVTSGTDLDSSMLPSGSSYYIHNSTGSQSGNFNITGTGQMGTLVLVNGGGKKLTITSSASQASDMVLVFPPNNGGSTQVLSTDGSGNLSWQNSASVDPTAFVQNQNTAAQATSKFWISGVGAASELRTYDNAGTYYTAIKAQATGMTSSYTFILPAGYGGANALLMTDGAGVLSWTNSPVFTNSIVDNAAGTARSTIYRTAGVARVYIGVDTTAESGSNAGSNFNIILCNDAGAGIETIVSAARPAGSVINIGGVGRRTVAMSGMMTMAVTAATISQDTADGSDTRSITLAGGGAAGIARGGYITVAGNEKTSDGGNIWIQGGDNATYGSIMLTTGNPSLTALKIAYDGTVSFPRLNTTGYFKSTAGTMSVASGVAVGDLTGVSTWTPTLAGVKTQKPSTTVSLLHFDGKSGSRQIIDLVGYRWNSVASPLAATLSTAQTKFGASSLLLNGTSQFIELEGTNYSAWNLGTGAFTIECQVFFNSITGTQTILDAGGTAAGLVIRYVAGTGLQLVIAGTTTNFAWSPSTGTWYHVAVVRSGTSVYAWVAGAQIGTTQTNAGSIAVGSNAPVLGASGRLSGTAIPSNFLSAYVDEFVVSNTAKWITGFTAPAAAYDYASYTQIPASANDPVDAGMSLVADGSGNASLQAPRRVFVANFALTENVANTTKYFYSWRGAGATQDDAKRSGNSNGMANANSCSPIQLPFNGRIVKAILNVQGTGVNQGSATYPCSYQVQLYRVGWTTEHDSTINSGSPVQINFPLYGGVGGFSVGATNAKSERTDIGITVNAGDMLGLKFLNGATATLVGITQMAFVSFVIEEVM